MKKLSFILALVVLASVSLFTTSCKKDEVDVVVDVRDDVIGTYNYVFKMYVFEGSSLTYLGADSDETGTMIVKKNEANAATIDFFEGAELQFQGNKIEEASNAIVFDIPSQTITENGVLVDIVGYEYWDFSGTKYHGAYMSADKKITAAFQFTVLVEDELLIFVATYEGTKQ